MKIPANNLWTQTNQADILGILHETQNISFDKEGKATLSTKAFARATTNDDAELSTPLAIKFFDGDYYVLTDDELFTFNLYTSNLTQVSGAPAFGNNSDLEVCYGRLYVTVNANLSYYDGSWTNSIESLTAGVPHPMTVFDSNTTYRLAIGNGNEVILVDESGNKSSTSLILPTDHEVNSLAFANGYLYVGTRNTAGGCAYLYIWNGDSANVDFGIPTGGTWVFSVVPYQGNVAALIDTGQLITVSGTSAYPLAAFPVYYDPTKEWAGTSDYTGRVMHRGMIQVGNNLYICIDGELRSGFMPEMKSGLWVFDPAVGLYHRASNSIDTPVIDNSLSVTSSVITTAAAHNLKTGDQVEFRSVSGLSGVAINTTYYAKVESTTTLKLALSKKALANGDYVSITGTAGPTDRLVYIPNTDYHAGYNGRPGAVCRTVPSESQYTTWNSPVIWGGRGKDLDGDTIDYVCALHGGFNVGRLETQRIYSPNVEQAWKRLHTFLDGLDVSTEEVIVKMRSEYAESSGVLKGIWSSTTELNADTTLLSEDEWRDIDVGDELVFVDGYGRGYSAHVTAVNDNGSTVVLTLDEAIGTTGKPAYFYYTNYQKVFTHDNTRGSRSRLKDTLADQDAWIQIKVELRGYEMEISHFDLENDKQE